MAFVAPSLPQPGTVDGVNPAVVLVSDTGTLVNGRTNASILAAPAGLVALDDTAPIPTLVRASNNSELQARIAEYLCIGKNNAFDPATARHLVIESEDGPHITGTLFRVQNDGFFDATNTAASTTMSRFVTAVDINEPVTLTASPSARTFEGRISVNGVAGSTWTSMNGTQIHCSINGPGNGGSLIGYFGVLQPDALLPAFTGALQSYQTVSLNMFQNFTAGSIATAQGILIRCNQATGTPFQVTTEIYGLDLFPIASYGAPLAAAIHVRDQPAGTHALWFRSNTASTRAGIAFGGSADTTLYRGAAGVLESPGDIRFDHPRCLRTPSIAAGAGAGTAPTLSISGTDVGFTITLTQGNPTATGVIATVTFGKTWTTAPSAGVSPGNANVAALSGTSVPFITTTATTLVLNSGSTGLVAGTQYIWRIVVNPAN